MQGTYGRLRVHVFPALMPAALRDVCHIIGVELDPVTVRIVKLLQPRVTILNEDFARAELKPHFDLAIGNPPFSDRAVRSDRAFRALGLRLHDYFIAKSIDRLKRGGLAAFVTSSGTLDKADATAREHIATMADLVGAVRLPEGSFRTEAGTVVVDILFFRKRGDGESAGNDAWLDLAEVRAATEDEGAIRINRYDVKHGLIVRRRDRRYLDSRFSSSMSVSREGRESPHCQSTRFRSSLVAPGAKLRTIIAR
jgi:predicted RNA methylase